MRAVIMQEVVDIDLKIQFPFCCKLEVCVVWVWGVVNTDLKNLCFGWLCCQFEVRAVLVRGMVDADLRDQSLAAGIAMVQQIPFPALHALQAACQVDLVTYILDAHEVSWWWVVFGVPARLKCRLKFELMHVQIWCADGYTVIMILIL